VDWLSKLGELNLPQTALLVLAFVVIEMTREVVRNRKNGKGKEESPTLPADVFAKIMGAAVAEAVKPFSAVVANNTEALYEVKEALTKQNGKVDNILRDTGLLLQQRQHMGGGDDGCSSTG
jgi:hypothetical protein